MIFWIHIRKFYKKKKNMSVVREYKILGTYEK